MAKTLEALATADFTAPTLPANPEQYFLPVLKHRYSELLALINNTNQRSGQFGLDRLVPLGWSTTPKEASPTSASEMGWFWSVNLPWGMTPAIWEVARNWGFAAGLHGPKIPQDKVRAWFPLVSMDGGWHNSSGLLLSAYGHRVAAVLGNVDQLDRLVWPIQDDHLSLFLADQPVSVDGKHQLPGAARLFYALTREVLKQLPWSEKLRHGLLEVADPLTRQNFGLSPSL